MFYTHYIERSPSFYPLVLEILSFTFLAATTHRAHEELLLFSTSFASIDRSLIVRNLYGFHVAPPQSLEALVTLFQLELRAPTGRVLSLAAGLAFSPTSWFDASVHNGCGIHRLCCVTCSWQDLLTCATLPLQSSRSLFAPVFLECFVQLHIRLLDIAGR